MEMNDSKNSEQIQKLSVAWQSQAVQSLALIAFEYERAVRAATSGEQHDKAQLELLSRLREFIAQYDKHQSDLIDHLQSLLDEMVAVSPSSILLYKHDTGVLK